MPAHGRKTVSHLIRTDSIDTDGMLSVRCMCLCLSVCLSVCLYAIRNSERSSCTVREMLRYLEMTDFLHDTNHYLIKYWI